MDKYIIKILAFILIFKSFNINCSTFVFCHGYGGDENQYLHYKQKNWSILPGKVISFNFPEVNAGGIRVNDKVVNFGQEGDIQAIKKTVDDILKKNPKEEIVLVGVSRGASAIINFASRYPKNIKAMVVEAPFDDFLNVVDNLVSGFKVGWIPGAKSCGRYFASRKFPAYKRNGITPLKSLGDLSKHNIPILFVHSHEDKLVPICCSGNLFKKISDDKSNVHFLELASGRHANYQFGSSAKRYLLGVHAFYKKYKIDRDAKLAKEGEGLSLFEQNKQLCCATCGELCPRIFHECPKYIPGHPQTTLINTVWGCHWSLKNGIGHK